MPAWGGLHRELRIVAAVGGAIVLSAVVAASALADNGPHVAAVNSGSSTLTADSCAGCHRAHTAQGPLLIARATNVELCLVCHDTAALGATTNVLDGIAAGTSRGLKGGGFANALMDTGWTGAATSRPSTSAHLMDGTTTATMWGNGAIGSGFGKAAVTLTCTDCHNPHGTGGYRILRPIPNGSGASAGIDISDDAVKTYTVASAQNRYFGELYWPVETSWGPYYDWQKEYALTQWCAQCHTRYDAVESGTGHIDSGDPTYKYRHMTRYPAGSINCGLCHPGPNGINASNPFGISGLVAHEGVCENCHVAHGSSAVMGTYSGVVAWPDTATTPNGNARSSLLRLDNRGVCVGCHDPTT